MSKMDCGRSVGTCFLLSISYVASFYVWTSQYNRNHPSTIKRRFFSVFMMMLLSPIFLYIALNEQILKEASLWEIMGIRWSGLMSATIMPLVLTMVLFLGPISIQIVNDVSTFSECSIRNNIRDLIWWRNHIVAPLSEEVTFRACMLPALLQCFQSLTAVIICPLFFGIAHFHHMAERINGGVDFKTALIVSCFQAGYTTVFGVYSAYLFMRTGHLMAPFIAHAFCNHMGFPDFAELVSSNNGTTKRTIFAGLFLTGFILWLILLKPLTNPQLYSNRLYITL